MSRKYRPSPERHRPVSSAERLRGIETARRYALGANYTYIRSTRAILEFARDQDLLPEESVVALQDWEDKYVGDLPRPTRKNSGRTGLSRRETAFIGRRSGLELEWLCHRSGEMAMELAMIAPHALVQDLGMSQEQVAHSAEPEPFDIPS